jgi:hypothetical protein
LRYVIEAGSKLYHHVDIDICVADVPVYLRILKTQFCNLKHIRKTFEKKTIFATDMIKKLLYFVSL